VHGLAGVDAEVQERLYQLLGVRLQHEASPLLGAGHRHPARVRGHVLAQLQQDLLEEQVEFQRPRLRRPQAGEGQEIADDGVQRALSRRISCMSWA